jgi:hypothetical protein
MSCTAHPFFDKIPPNEWNETAFYNGGGAKADDPYNLWYRSLQYKAAKGDEAAAARATALLQDYARKASVSLLWGGGFMCGKAWWNSGEAPPIRESWSHRPPFTYCSCRLGKGSHSRAASPFMRVPVRADMASVEAGICLRPCDTTRAICQLPFVNMMGYYIPGRSEGTRTVGKKGEVKT